MTGRVTDGNNNSNPESGARPVLSFEYRVACQPAEHIRWKFSESDGPLRPANYRSSDPGSLGGIVTGTLWQCGLLQQQSPSPLPCLVWLRHPKSRKAWAVILCR